MEIFDRTVILRWMESSKITAISWCYNTLIIGNDVGELYAFQSAAVESRLEADVYKFAKVSGKTIAQICPLEPKEWLLVLNSDGDLYTVDAFFNGQPSILRKRVTCISRQLIEGVTDESATYNALKPLSSGTCFCVGTEAKLYIYTGADDRVELKRCIPVDSIPLAASWLNDIIVVGTKEAYHVMNTEGTTSHELCSNVRVEDKDGYDAGVLTASCVDKDVMVVCQHIGIFYNTETLSLSRKNTIQWSNVLEALGCVPPFIIGITVDKVVEIYGIRDQLLYQTIDQTNSKFAYYMPSRLSMIVATPSVVSVLKQKNYYQCLVNVMEQRKLKQAMHMGDVYFPPEHPTKYTEAKIAHTVAGWVRFNDVNFPMAFQHFSLGDVDIVHLMAFWRHYADLDVPESYVYNIEVPEQLRAYIPRAMDIREFVEQRFRDLKTSLPPGTTVSKLLEMANISFATFLLKYFDEKAYLKNHGSVSVDLHKPLLSSLEKTNLLLLAECDDPRCNIIINRPHEESFIQVEECKKPLIDMDKGEVFAKMLIKKERYKEAMEIMAKCIKAKLDTRTEEETSLKLKTTCCELASCLNIHLENRQRYYADPKDTAMPDEDINNMLKTHLPILLASYPNAALDVLTKNHAMLPFTTDEIIAMIELHSPKNSCMSKSDMRVKYLEDLVITNKYGNLYENTLLAKHYINELIAHKKARNTMDDTARGLKKTLLALMESNNNFDLTELQGITAKLDIVEVTVLIYNKCNKHSEALRTLFERWRETDRLKVCEAYCLCFGDVTSDVNVAVKETPFKRLFSNLEYWMAKAREWPLSNHLVYKIKSETSIDKLLFQLLKIIAEHSKEDDACVYMARDLLSKYIPLCTYNSELNGSSIINLIPDDWNFSIFANVITQLQLKAVHEERTIAMKRGLTRSIHTQTSKQLYQLTCVPPSTIDTTSVCAICQGPIKLGMSIAIPPPNHKENTQQQIIMHEQCAKNIHDK